MANTVQRISKPIKDESIINMLINIKEEDITSSFIIETFGEFNGKAKIYQYDTFTVPKGMYGSDKVKNTEPFVTTAGMWIFNKYFIEKDLFDLFQYIDEPITKKKYGKISKQLAYAYTEERISLDVIKNFLLKTQLWMQHATILSWSWSEKMLTITDVTDKKKAELKKKYAKELAEGDIVAAEKMEKELLNYAIDYIGFDPGMDGFNSGSGGSIGNNFKNMYCMKGAIRNPDPDAKKQYDIAFSNYANGIEPEEYALFCKSLSAGPFSRANKTSVGGYWEKLLISALQHLRVVPGTDCGTKKYITQLLTPDNLDDWIYNYMITPKGLVELTSQNANQYFGKEVKFRFSSLCEYNKGKGCFCSVCAGNIWNRHKITNVGMIMDIVASIVKNKYMKAFHDSTISTIEMDPMKAFSWK